MNDHDLRWGESHLVPVPHGYLKSQRRGVCNYHYNPCLCTFWHCRTSLLLPSTFVSFIALWAINISQYYHLAWFLNATLNSTVIGKHFAFDFLHYPVPHSL